MSENRQFLNVVEETLSSGDEAEIREILSKPIEKSPNNSFALQILADMERIEQLKLGLEYAKKFGIDISKQENNNKENLLSTIILNLKKDNLLHLTTEEFNKKYENTVIMVDLVHEHNPTLFAQMVLKEDKIKRTPIALSRSDNSDNSIYYNILKKIEKVANPDQKIITELKRGNEMNKIFAPQADGPVFSIPKIKQ
ncbi:MAG: hypothetical protein ACREBF_04100 [Candidatus Micrarchaeales archaeon]